MAGMGERGTRVAWVERMDMGDMRVYEGKGSKREMEGKGGYGRHEFI